MTEISTPGRQRPRRRRRRAVQVCKLQHHKFGVAAVAFGTRGAGASALPASGAMGSAAAAAAAASDADRDSLDNWLLASAGFEHDRQIVVWKWMDQTIVGLATVTSRVVSLSFCPVTNTLVTVGPNHLSFWSHDGDMDSVDESTMSLLDPTIKGKSAKYTCTYDMTT